MKKTYLIIGLVLIVAFAGFYQFFAKQPLPEPESALIFPEPRVLAPFSLTDQHDKTFTERDLRGVWNFFFFGYTNCPDVCPATLRLMQQAWEILDKQQKADNVRFIFVSVDPERDTPENLDKYVSYFNPKFLGLTGSELQISRLGEQFGVFYVKESGAGAPDNYLIEHTGSVMFVDPEGRYIANLSPPFTAETLANDILIAEQHYRR
jgi:protein SCO1/2